MYDLGGYPGAVLQDGEGDTAIVGEVLELPDEADLIRRLDEYEGFDPDRPEASLYVRVERPVVMAGGGRVVASVYEYRGETGGRAPIPDGDYRSWRGRP